MNRLFLLALSLLATSTACMRAGGTLDATQAKAKLNAGAMLVDVRTDAEFQDKKLPGAINIPVDQIQSGITNATADKGRVILLHCRSGSRGALAEQQLRALGYTNAFNIGSFDRAKDIVAAKP